MPNLLLKSPHLLIVDDEPDNLQQLMDWLNPRQAILFQARSGEQALKVLKQTPIDAVISDWQLPGLSGLELVQHLRQTGFKGPLLIVTGFMLDAEHLQAAFAAGANDYLRKPLNAVEFNARLDKSLLLYQQQYALERFNFSQNKLMELMTEHMGSEIQRLMLLQNMERATALSEAQQTQRQNSTQQLEAQFQKLMTWSRYRFALSRIAIQHFEVRQLFKSLEKHFPSDSWRLHLKGGTGVFLQSNLDLLQRVLQQLVDNALRYSAEHVTLKCSVQGQVIRLEVADRGHLSEGQLERLVDDQNCGLGLRICHDLLVLLGSKLQAQKRSQGGSRFYFELPQ